MALEETPIPGLVVLRLDVHEDDRGWFKECWHREEMTAAGLPDFGPVQHNIAFNQARGTTRGIHAEPWDKLVSVVSGRAFGAWVDLRAGESFGTVFHLELDPATAVFVPRGVGNSYQTLEPGTSYSYLVNEHWRATDSYPAVDVADPGLAIPWPISLDQATISGKDRQQPRLDAITPVAPRRMLITGADGQLGRALAAEFPEAHAVARSGLDITDAAAVEAWPWAEYDVIVNGAAYTAVDAAETDDGRRQAWAVNATGPALLTRAAQRHGLTLVHFSTDYVFDGSSEEHDETEPLSPLGVYGQSKAAGDLAVEAGPRHYLIRTSWVIGDGPNFVRTMQRLAAAGENPSVVDDQWGRLSFTDDIARALRHLITTRAAFGTYNMSNAGPVMSWAEVARAVFALCGRDPTDVRPVSAAEYAEARRDTAPRPPRSVLDLSKLRAAGFASRRASEALGHYLAQPSIS